MTVKSGVVAFRMGARPDAMCVCPQAMRENGKTLSSDSCASISAATDLGNWPPSAPTILLLSEEIPKQEADGCTESLAFKWR